MYFDPKRVKHNRQITHIYKKSSIYIICVAVLFITVGFLTTVSPAYRVSSTTITNWTGDLDSSFFLYLLGMENKSFRNAVPEDEAHPEVSNLIFEMATNIRPSDTRSLLGQELPGFLTFQNEIIVAGEGTDYTNLPVESSPPLDDVLKDRDAVIDENDEEEDTEKPKEEQLNTGERDVVLVYNTHNRESFLPHLPDTDNPDDAQHGEVNIGKVSQRFADALEKNGIGAKVDKTDIMSVLKQQGMAYHESYQASRDVVREAFASSEDITYSFDLHRDAIARDKTTKKINGENYARVMFVVGAEYADYDKNLELANKLHNLTQEKYPGLSRGVIKKKGSGSNGVYNQDLSPNAMLIEFGGVHNSLDELYRSADAVAEVFSDYYWDAEKVNSN
ncbi:stage II sporulation protein P [Lentibacillus persicus]|uniref:Stage II sporulation protein P n=1 Tax=Lentibacillus persicus TaxID=640948 RepID=A0A1I1TJV0_9BACI|nr:stage II sporulation protein P [Lentibacillus persicus]SFD55760.1 stage II sporulation protein P [Lentibacillus persicus]